MIDYRAVIFDMDGILFDTERIYQETWHELADERGIVLPPDYPQRICGSTLPMTHRIVEDVYGVADGVPLVRECRKRVAKRLEAGVPVKRGVPELLAYFKENGIRTAVASSGTIERIRLNLEMTDLTSFFDVLVCGQDVVNGKPAPDIFLFAAERLGERPEDCLVFEDSVNGVRAGIAAGSRVIMVPDQVPPTDELRAGCTMICKDMTEVLARLRGE